MDFLTQKQNMFKRKNFLFLFLILLLAILIPFFYIRYYKNSVDIYGRTAYTRPNEILLKTPYGMLLGSIYKLTMYSFYSRNIAVWLSIPYSEPPIGKLRFRPPKRKSNWNGIYRALQWPNPCIQPDNRLQMKNYNFSEDCLYLNIWSPFDGYKFPTKPLKPVLVLIHTGAFIFGSSSEPTYNGFLLSGRNDIVVVTFNYRLNFYGYFYSGEGTVTPNLGMLDQVAALRWVKKNIKLFNGDPNKITLLGQASGGLSVGMHITSSLSRNLFQQAIIMSGSPLQTTELTKPTEVLKFWVNYARKIRCLNSTDDQEQKFIPKSVIDCIVNKVQLNRNLLPTMSLVKKLSSDSLFVNLPIVIDGYFQKKNQYQLLNEGSFNKNLTLLFGYTNDEGSWIAMMEDKKRFHPRRIPELNYTRAEDIAKEFVSKMNAPRKINESVILDYYLTRPFTYYNETILNRGTKMYKTRMTSFLLTRLVTSILGDYYIVCPENNFADRLLSDSNNISIYQYYWNYKGNPRSSPFWNAFSKVWCGRWMGACHSFEMYAIFGIPHIEFGSFNRYDRLVSSRIMQMVFYFTHFKKIFWPRYNNNRAYYVIDDIIGKYTLEHNLRVPICEKIWNNYL